jgi:hypothetical protein
VTGRDLPSLANTAGPGKRPCPVQGLLPGCWPGARNRGCRGVGAGHPSLPLAAPRPRLPYAGPGSLLASQLRRRACGWVRIVAHRAGAPAARNLSRRVPRAGKAAGVRGRLELLAEGAVYPCAWLSRAVAVSESLRGQPSTCMEPARARPGGCGVGAGGAHWRSMRGGLGAI